MEQIHLDIEKDKEYLSSLKSLETENYVDRVFYRPLGYKIAYSLRRTGITPNTITILSVFVGMAGAYLFYYENSIELTLLGILGLVCANILDCVDGQLARLTGIKSKIGRILDGVAGYLWFLVIYLAIATRVYQATGYWWIFLVIILSALSHAFQAAITDYYKTLHLYFVSPQTGKEFETIEQVKEKMRTTKGMSLLFMYLYIYYTIIQHKATPELQSLLQDIRKAYPHEDIPQEVRVTFRRGSRMVMKIIDLLTFNGRSIPLFIILLTGQVWFYFVYEVIFLNIVLVVAKNQHESLSRYFRFYLRGDRTTV